MRQINLVTPHKSYHTLYTQDILEQSNYTKLGEIHHLSK